MPKINSKNPYLWIGIAATIISVSIGVGNCVNDTLESKVDKALYESQKQTMEKAIDKVDDRLVNMEREQIKQGKALTAIAVKLDVEIE